MKGCTKCYGTYSSNECTDCDNFITIYEDGKIKRWDDPNKICEEDDEEKCLICDKEKNECKTCNIAYKLVDGECKPDFFMKAVFLTKQKDDKIDIINDYSIVSHIYENGEKKTITSTSYQFQEEGNQTVYFQFKSIFSSYEYLIFRRIKHLKSAIFSSFDEYKIGL